MNIIRKIVRVLRSFSLMILIMGICLLSTLATFLNPATYLMAMEQAKNVYQSI